MWLLSQDGTKLVNANSVWVEGNKLLAEHNSGEETAFTIGEFKDKREAMMALDEIANVISGGNRRLYHIKWHYYTTVPF